MNATTRIIETYAELETYDWKIPGAYPHIDRPAENAPRSEFLAYQKLVDARFISYKAAFEAYHNVSLQGPGMVDYDLTMRLFFLVNTP